MVQAIPTRTFLLKQTRGEDGKMKDVLAEKGLKINLTEEEAITFWGSLEIKQSDKDRLLKFSKTNSLYRKV